MKARAFRVTRWGWLATTFALVVALLATAWASQRSAARAADTLIRGQTDVLAEAFREYMRMRSGPPVQAALDSFVTDRSDAGVRYVGVRLPLEGDVLEAGASLGGPPTGEGGGRRGGPPEPGFVGDRLRLDMPILMCSRPPCTGRGGMSPASATLEIEPVVAEELAAGARRTFIVAAIVAAALLAIALLFWRQSIRREQEQLRFEQERRLASLGEMSAVLAHEIRNPLASLKGNAQLLAERLSGKEPEVRKVERIVSEAQRLEVLTADLLDFARTTSIEPVTTDPVELLQRAVEEVGAEAFALRTTGVPPWPLDGDHVLRALTNLLRNARQASPPDARSEVGISTRNGTLVFRIRDFGPGIPPGDETRIFEPFYTTRTSGTGLGLAVARRIAELHGGSITAANHAGGGAVFEFTIPRSEM